MSDMWGLLGPETLPSLRRTRGLGIAASVRRFNDLAVPGLGGVWFGKQIFLALLGVAVAEYVRAWGNSPDIRKISKSPMPWKPSPAGWPTGSTAGHLIRVCAVSPN